MISYFLISLFSTLLRQGYKLSDGSSVAAKSGVERGHWGWGESHVGEEGEGKEKGGGESGRRPSYGGGYRGVLEFHSFGACFSLSFFYNESRKQ